MAIVKDAQDPQKPVAAPQAAAPRATSKEAENAPQKKSASKPTKVDDYNDFNAMTITLQDQDAQTAASADVIGIMGGDSGPSMFSKLLEDSTKPLSFDDAMKMGTLLFQDMLRLDTSDVRVQSMRTGIVSDYEAGKKYYVVGKDLEKYESRRATESSLGSLGLGKSNSDSIPTKFEVKTAGQIQSDLVASINKAAALTGVPPAMLGALAGIESGFNNPTMQKSPTGAIGVVQQTGGYRDTVWSKYGDFVSQHVPEAREAMKGGLTRQEKVQLAFNEDSAFIIVGLRAKELEKKYGLDLNTPRGMAMVYLEHNSGEGSVQRLLKGQMTSDTIRGHNPAIYRGNNTPEAVIAATERKMVSYASAYEKRADQIESVQMASAKPAADAAIAKASTSSAAAIKDGAIASITNKPDVPDSNMDARDRKIAQSGPAPVLS